MGGMERRLELQLQLDILFFKMHNSLFSLAVQPPLLLPAVVGVDAVGHLAFLRLQLPECSRMTTEPPAPALKVCKVVGKFNGENLPSLQQVVTL